ncbi:MAG: hypothetical protein KA175_02890 [Flavobacteriales bacterium]|nr:hypothetical protein [Flavobacteriales bacterium]MBP6696537.1 hypothetical protein [Flavobacteriales bacterium]
MAHTHKEFRQFNTEIRLNDSKRDDLRRSRNAVRETILSQFKTNGIPMPQFKAQGSFVMDTIVNPIDYDFDLDLGVYFIGDLAPEERPDPKDFHEAVLQAVKDQTHEVYDKDACVRVRYAKKYHIDLPIYYRSYTHPELAHKKDGWIWSDPLEFIAWFEGKTDSGFRIDYLLQEALRLDYDKWKEDIRKNDVPLRRVVRYLKAWADFQGKEEMPGGICLTILAAEHYVRDVNDDAAFHRTIERVYSSLQAKYQCLRPTTPVGEDLFARCTATQRDYFMSRLQALVHDGRKALDADSWTEACSLWQKHFGDRFPCPEPTQVKEMVKPLAATIGTATKPYCQ